MAEYLVEDRNTGIAVYAYTADIATDFPEYPFAQYNHILKKSESLPVAQRWVTQQQFIDRLDDVFPVILNMAKQSVEVEAWVERFKLATVNPDGTSVDLLDQRTIDGVRTIGAALVAQGVVGAEWVDSVLYVPPQPDPVTPPAFVATHQVAGLGEVSVEEDGSVRLGDGRWTTVDALSVMGKALEALNGD